jgi:hypothetical protein
MSTQEWRITKTTIEAEMLRLAALLSEPSCSGSAPSALARHEAKSSNLALHDALEAVGAHR